MSSIIIEADADFLILCICWLTLADYVGKPMLGKTREISEFIDIRKYDGNNLKPVKTLLDEPRCLSIMGMIVYLSFCSRITTRIHTCTKDRTISRNIVLIMYLDSVCMDIFHKQLHNIHLNVQ